MNESEIGEDQVRDEHIQAVNVVAHWAYLFGVLAVGLMLMLGLIAMLGGTGG